MSVCWISSVSERIGLCGLEVASVGYSDKQGRENLLSPRRVLEQFAVVYLLEGAGFFRSASQPERTVRGGDLMLLLPGEWHDYGPRSGDPWVEYFILFDGFIPRTHLASGVFDPLRPVIRPDKDAGIDTLFRAAWQNAAKQTPAAVEEITVGLFRIITGSLIQERSAGSAVRKLVDSVRQELGLRFRDALDLQTVLESTGYCYDYVRRVFREQTGMPPNTYLTRLRMDEAKNLLTGSELTIAQIGDRIGFEDPAYLCRTFKKWTGMPPSVFRRKFRQ
jgi:AraC-like DNA-binding protein